jgi:Zn-dependent protease with chaperone function
VNPPLVLVPLALEWVVIASTIAPLWLGLFSKRPRLGIASWLLLFLSSGIALAVAIVVATWSVIYNFVNLENNSQDLFLTIVYSVAPWLLFAMAGVALNLINLRLDAVMQKFKRLIAEPVLPGKHLLTFESVSVEVFELNSAFAIALSRPRKILLSSGALAELSDAELEAVLWHEYAHLAARHNGIKRLVKIVALLAGFLRASKVMSHEIDRLCEIAADQYALKRVDASVLKSAREKFL